MMRQFRIFLLKEFRHITRDRLTMLILLIMPLVLILLFGYVITTEVRDSRVVVLDEAKTSFSRLLVDRVKANEYFLVVDYLSSSLKMEDLLLRSEADILLVINEDMGIQILSDGSEPNMAQTRTSYLMQVLTDCLMMASGVEQGGIRITQRMLFNPQLRSEYNFVPGIIGIIILLICSMMTSIAIVREKERGTMEVLLASPLPPLVIILAKLVPYFVISSFNVVSILMLSHYLMGVPVVGSLLAYLLVFLLYVLVSLALGLLISSAVSSQLVAMLLSLLLIVPSLYFSGLVFNLDSMPVPFQIISNLMPARWFTDASRKLMIQGAPAVYVLKDALILLFMALAFLSVSFRLFKKRLE